MERVTECLERTSGRGRRRKRQRVRDRTRGTSASARSASTAAYRRWRVPVRRTSRGDRSSKTVRGDNRALQRADGDHGRRGWHDLRQRFAQLSHSEDHPGGTGDDVRRERGYWKTRCNEPAECHFLVPARPRVWPRWGPLRGGHGQRRDSSHRFRRSDDDRPRPERDIGCGRRPGREPSTRWAVAECRSSKMARSYPS